MVGVMVREEPKVDELRKMIELARRRTGRPGGVGWNWACFCLVCSKLRTLGGDESRLLTDGAEPTEGAKP